MGKIERDSKTSLAAEQFALMALNNPRFAIPQELLKQTVQLFPDESKIRTTPPIVQITASPDNFDELLTIQKEFQTGNVLVPRAPHVHERYMRAVKTQDYGNIDQITRALMDGKRIHISRNDFPLDVGTDTIHNILWYLPSISIDSRYKYLAAWLFHKDIDPSDVVIRKNPIYNRSIPQIGHYHIFHRLYPERLEADCE